MCMFLVIISDVACVDSTLNPNHNPADPSTGPQFLQSYPFGKCASGCSFFDNDCSNGVCICSGEDTGVGVGFDCALTRCPTECGANAECDYAVGACRCVEGRRGDGCALTYTGMPPDEIVETVNESETEGMPVGLFTGLFIFLYICGCICAVVVGLVGGTRYLESRRDRAQRA